MLCEVPKSPVLSLPVLPLARESSSIPGTAPAPAGAVPCTELADVVWRDFLGGRVHEELAFMANHDKAVTSSLLADTVGNPDTGAAPRGQRSSLRAGREQLPPSQPCSAEPIPAPGCPPHTPTRKTSILQRYFRDSGRETSSDLLSASQICESLSDVRQRRAHGGASLLPLLGKRKFHCFAHRRWL